MTELIELLRDFIERQRKYASFWHWPGNKSGQELEVVRDFLNSMHEAGDRRYRSPRATGADWPDCIVLNENGVEVGLEVTELVDEAAIVSVKRGKHVYRHWEDKDILSALGDRIRSKDLGSQHGGLYEKVLLLIHTDEPELDAKRLGAALSSVEFNRPQNIDEVYLMTSNGSKSNGFPYFSLQFAA